MSTSIPSTGLFVEAAYGVEGLSDQGTAGADMENLAWQQAMGAALGTRMVGEGANPNLDAPPEGEQLPNDPGDVLSVGSPINNAEMKEKNPVAWDRLSMTVSSMVAWGMQVEMADDVSASQVDAETLMPVTPELGVEPAIGADAFPGASLQRSTESRASTQHNDPSMPTDDSHLVRDGQRFVDVKPEYPAAVVPADTSTDLRGGVGMDGSSGLDPLQQMVPNAEPVAPLADSVVQEPAVEVPPTLQDAVQRVLEGLQKADTGSTVPLKSVQKSSFEGANPATNQSHDRPTSANEIDKSMTPSAKSVSINEVPTLKAHQQARRALVEEQQAALGRQRLEGIRAVLAELETQVDIETMSDIVRRPLHTDVVRNIGVRSVATRSVVPTPVGRMSGAGPIENTPATNENSSFSPETAESLGIETDLQSMDDDLFFSQEKRDAEMAKPRSGNNTAKVNTSKAALDNMNTQADLKAHIAGTENMEITSDQENLMRVQVGEARTIDASETPELAVQDLNQIDLDIEDPMGTVRLAMSKEAEEVSVRLQTPQEVLEEYREMRDEMDERLAEQGLDLGEFSANAQDDTQSDADANKEDNKEHNQGAEQSARDGRVGLANEGTSARLINRIV